MLFRKWAWLPALLTCLTAEAASIQFSDSTLLDTNWEEEITFTRGNARSVSIVDASSGGNPGAFRQFTHTYSSGGDPAGADITVWHYSNQFNIDPASLGNIDTITVSMDARVISSPFSDAIGFGIAFKQDGVRYGIGIHEAQVPLNEGSNAILASQGGWHAFSFADVSSTLENLAGFDLSGGGNPIEVGMYSSNGTSTGSTSSTGGLDNFVIDIEHTHVPLPAAAWLFLFGSLGLAARIRH